MLPLVPLQFFEYTSKITFNDYVTFLLANSPYLSLASKTKLQSYSYDQSKTNLNVNTTMVHENHDNSKWHVLFENKLSSIIYYLVSQHLMLKYFLYTAVYPGPYKWTCISQEANPDFLNNQTLPKTQLIWVFLKQKLFHISIWHLIISHPKSHFINLYWFS